MTGGLERAASIDDLRLRARRRLPRFAFDFIDGGAESEMGLARNRSALDALTLAPRYLVDLSAYDTETTLFGKAYAAPFGIAPMGFINMAWPGADLAFARLAARERIPHAISTAASTPLEVLAEAAEGYAWFQIYVSNDREMTAHFLDRAEAAGCEALLVTVDVPTTGKRDRDIRNGLRIPFRPTPSILADLALHPRWSLGTLRAGAPHFANLSGARAGDYASMTLAEVQKRLLIADRFDWDGLKRLRERWKGPLLLKGVMRADDAEKAAAAGCDGLVVSNHGGRQADYAPASAEVLPAIAAAVAGRMTLILDSGVRRGADIARAKALGAEFALAGRAFAYGAGAGGAAGAARAFEILKTELLRTMGQIGQPVFRKIGPEALGP
ncbi:MAG: alpha-hydroxy acid oxidase [Pikeienuella sp.]|uniref:alpha-hydroxy acid oxidase n=1 Tax=Pikeienuella sp. TaxID=2831957 RepID=UPI00391A6F3D